MNSTQFKITASSDPVQSNILASPQPKENITMTVIFNQFNFKDAGKSLVNSAADKLRSNHPELGINIKYIEIPIYNNTRNQMLKAITNGPMLIS